MFISLFRIDRPQLLAIGCGVALLAAAARASAGDAGAAAPRPSAVAAPPVEDLVARALAAAPSLAARRARIDAARLALRAADAPADPMVEFEYRAANFPKWTVGSDPNSMIGASVRQPLLIGERKTARRTVAEADVGLRRAEEVESTASLATAVRTTYAEVYAVDRERAILADSREIARLLSETAMARYSAGGSDQASVLRAQLEQTRLSQRAVDLDARRAGLVASLNRLLNQPQETPFGEVGALPEPPPLSEALSRMPDLAADHAAGVAVRQADVAAAARRVDAARAELQPNFTVGGGLYWMGGADRLVTFSFGIEWPARKARKQLPMLAASERELEAARRDLDDSAAAVREEAARTVSEIERDERQIEQYRSGLLPQSSAAFDAVRAGYLVGRGDFSSVLDEFRQWTDARVELAGFEASRYAQRCRLDALVNPPGPDGQSPVGPTQTAAGKESQR
mgnify:CR=1 FL=1